MKKKLMIILFILIIFSAGLVAGLYYYGSQLYASGSQRWEDEVSAIDARYNGEYPQGGIIFYGSSSIRL